MRPDEARPLLADTKVPDVEGHRVYLKGELGKLSNSDHGREHVARSACRMDDFGLPPDAEGLAHVLPNQHVIDAFVDALSRDDVVALTMCFAWRDNGVPRKLDRARTSENRRVPVTLIDVAYAEPELHDVFRELDHRLADVATDERVKASGRYAMVPGPVAYPILLAETYAGAGGRCRVIDGVHRAVQLYVNGEPEIELCVLR